jgi:chromosomal replication initiator protein
VFVGDLVFLGGGAVSSNLVSSEVESPFTTEKKFTEDSLTLWDTTNQALWNTTNQELKTSTAKNQYGSEITHVTVEPSDSPYTTISPINTGSEYNPQNSSNFDDSYKPFRWEACLQLIEEKVESHLFEAYLSNLALGSLCLESRTAVVLAPNAFIGRTVIKDYQPLIKESLCSLLPFEVSLQIKVATLPIEKVAPSSVAPLVVLTRDRPSLEKLSSDRQDSNEVASGGIPINPRYNFDSYVVGNNNQFCHAAAQRVGEEPGASYNPLFIYGGVGLGKTHLLHAIGNKVLENNPSARVLYLSSESFTNELISALQAGQMAAFKNRMRSINLLLIDDIQFMEGKDRTQEEFFHTFNALYNAKNQIVITSDKLPQEIVGIEERLRTRFAWGLTADLQSPDFETRVAILQRKAAVDGYYLPEDVAHFIADNISSNVRELEGALTRLHAMSSLQGQIISLSLAESALKQLLKPKAVNVTIDDIKTAVALHFKLKVSDLSSKKRTRNLSFARHIAMYLCRTHTTASYPEIGGQFGGRDHSSVINGANKVSKTISVESSTRDMVKEIEERLSLK